MVNARSIIELWPSAEQFAADIGLKYRSHARVMKVRNSIPKCYWPVVAAAAKKRGLNVTEKTLAAAHDRDTAA